MKEIKIPQLIINKYSERPGLKQARTIAIWALLRKAYKDNTIRNYKSKLTYLSKVFGISEHVLRGLISEMERQGYATRLNGDLKMTPDHVLADKDCKKNKYYDHFNLASLTTWIMAQPLLSSLRQQNYKINRRLNKRHASKRQQKIKSIFHVNDLAKSEIHSVPNMSNQSIAKICGTTSPSSGYKHKRKFESMGIIQSIQRILIYGEVNNVKEARLFQKLHVNCGTFFFSRLNKGGKYDIYSYLSSAIV